MIKHIGLLRHCLGPYQCGKTTVYRNYFVIDVISPDSKACDALTKAGLMTEHVIEDDMLLYQVTKKGIDFLKANSPEPF